MGLVAATHLAARPARTSGEVLDARARGGLKFAAPVSYPVGTAPQYLAVGDFNGDGYPDLVTSNFTSNSVSVLMNKGNGTFAPAVNYAVGTNPLGLAVGDFTGNGHLDVAVANGSNSIGTTAGVSVLLGNGDGTFQPAVDYVASQDGAICPGYKNGSVSSLVVGDFNGDGKLDLAAVIECGDLVVLLGNGNGTFAPAVNYALGNPARTHCAAGSGVVGDFTRGGHLDVAITNDHPFNAGDPIHGAVCVLRGKGDGTFRTPVAFPAGSRPYGIAAGDFNGDGKLDLAVTNVDLNEVSVLLNKSR